MKVLVSALAVLLLTGGSSISARPPDLTAAGLELRMADPASGLPAMVSQIEDSMISGDMEPVEALIDQEGILDRATAGLHLRGAQNMKLLFSDSTRQSWDQTGVTRDFAGTNFRFLRVRTFKNRAGLLFRCAGENQSVNFYSFVIREQSPGNYRISDIYTLGMNEYTSETLRRSYLHLAASLLGEPGRALTPDRGAFADSLNEVAAISRQLREGDFSGVLEACATLPPAVQQDRSVLLIRLEAAENYSVTSRANVLEDWLKAYPDEMDLPLKLIEHYFSQERWNDAERLVNRVLDSTGGDARMLSKLGNINYHRNRDQNRLQANRSR